jgi:hypothetical protein
VVTVVVVGAVVVAVVVGTVVGMVVVGVGVAVVVTVAVVVGAGVVVVGLAVVVAGTVVAGVTPSLDPDTMERGATRAIIKTRVANNTIDINLKRCISFPPFFCPCYFSNNM